MKKFSIGKKFIIYQIVLGLILIVVIGFLVNIIYYEEAIGTVKATALSYVKTIAQTVDGDKAISYVKGKDKDDYYYDTLEYLNTLQRNTTMQYLYIMMPGDNNFTYIWDATGKGVHMELGSIENYAPDGKNYVEEVFKKNPTESVRILETDDWGEIACAFYPLLNSKGDPVAIVGTDIPVEDINQDIVNFVLSVSVGIVVIIALFTLLLFSIANKKIIMPIGVLESASEKILANLGQKETTKIPITSQDEIGELARAYEQMEVEIKKYMDRMVKVTAEKERIGVELNVATNIQLDMLPSKFPPFPEQKDFDIYAGMNAAKEVGGDFYDFFRIDEDHVALVIADVSGKGVPAALFMVIAKTLIKNRTLQGGTPAEVLRDVNNELCKNNKESFFVTAWLAIVNTKTGEVTSANAGHEHPVIKRKDGDFELLVYKHSMPLAAMEDVEYSLYNFDIERGDRLFVYTDGVPEATNKKDEQFGTTKMLRSLNKHPDASMKKLLEGLSNDIVKFADGQDQFDDITMLFFDYNEK